MASVEYDDFLDGIVQYYNEGYEEGYHDGYLAGKEDAKKETELLNIDLTTTTELEEKNPWYNQHLP